MILHTLSAGPDSIAFRDCLATLTAEDALVLLGDGVYAALPGSDYLSRLAATGAAIHVMQSDALAAGVITSVDGVAFIDMGELVTLTEHFPRQVAWF